MQAIVKKYQVDKVGHNIGVTVCYCDQVKTFLFITLFANVSNASSSPYGSKLTVRYWIPTCSNISICLYTSSGVP